MKNVAITISTVMAFLVMCSAPALAARDGLVVPDAAYIDDYTIKGEVDYFTEVDPADTDGNIHVIVEIPKGTTGKWEVDPESGNIVWEFKKGKPRTVEYMGGYPVNYGTVPKTVLSEKLGGEGESVDVVLFGDQLKRGAVVKAKLIGILKIVEGDGVFDDKLLAVGLGSPEYSANDFDELNRMFDGVGSVAVQWFTNYKGPDSGMRSRGVGTPDEAKRLFYAAMKEFGKE